MQQRPRSAPRGCLATVIIGVLMFGILGMGIVTADALSARPPVPITVGQGVSISPSLAWQFASRFESPTGEEDGVALTRGSATMLVYTSDQPAEDELADVTAELLGEGLVSVGEAEPGALHPDHDAFRFGFSGAMPGMSAAPVEGETVAVAGSGVTVIFVAWSEVGTYQHVRAEIEALIAQASIP